MPFGLNASATSPLTPAKNCQVYRKTDSHSMASKQQLGVSSYENATSIRLLHNAAGPDPGRRRHRLPGRPRLLPAARLHHDPLGRQMQRPAGRNSSPSSDSLQIRLEPQVKSSSVVLAANCLVLLLSMPNLLARFREGVTTAGANGWTRQIQGRPPRPSCPATTAKAKRKRGQCRIFT